MRFGRYESSEGNNVGTAVTFFLIGLGAGALVALVLAPKTGKQFRRDLKRGYEDAKETLEDWTEEAKDRARDARERVRDVAERGADLADDIGNTVREKVEPLRRGSIADKSRTSRGLRSRGARDLLVKERGKDSLHPTKNVDLRSFFPGAVQPRAAVGLLLRDRLPALTIPRGQRRNFDRWWRRHSRGSWPGRQSEHPLGCGSRSAAMPAGPEFLVHSKASGAWSLGFAASGGASSVPGCLSRTPPWKPSSPGPAAGSRTPAGRSNPPCRSSPAEYRLLAWFDLIAAVSDQL